MKTIVVFEGISLICKNTMEFDILSNILINNDVSFGWSKSKKKISGKWAYCSIHNTHYRVKEGCPYCNYRQFKITQWL